MRAWLISFTGISGKFDLLVADSSNISGSQAKVYIEHGNFGHQGVTGYVSLKMGNQTTEPLAHNASSALETMPNIGEIHTERFEIFGPPTRRLMDGFSKPTGPGDNDPTT